MDVNPHTVPNQTVKVFPSLQEAELVVDFRLLFESSPHSYLVLLPNTPVFTIVAVNDSYLAATGTQRSAILGQGLFKVFPDNPNDPAATGVSDLRTSLERVIQDRVQDVMGIQKYDIPRRGMGESGFEVKYWSPINTPVFDKDGSITFIIHRVEDVTEFIQLRERSSEEYARIERVETHAEQLEAEILESSRSVKEANRQIKAANEELERRERELAELNERLKELDQAKTEFFSNVSHEFRTPLTLILGPIEDALSEGIETDPQIQYERLEVIHRNALRLLKLVNNLLDFSRIEAGRIQASYQPTDLSALTTDFTSNFRSAFEKGGLKLVVDCPPLPEPVYVDHDMWEKIVLNLLSNAFKHTFEGEIEVRLQGMTHHVELIVRDTGIGIPAEQLPHLFERFHRVPNARSRTHEGSGIGLALVHELVKLHGGKITVDSVVDQGSTFIVSIPTGKAHLPADRVEAKSTLASTALGAQPFVEEALRWLPAEALSTIKEGETRLSVDEQLAWPGVTHPGKARILLADDNLDMRDYVCRLLQPYCDVEAVADGSAALEAAYRHPPDLVLSDIMMPRMDGFELLKTLREDSSLKMIPVVLLSARAGEEAKIEGLEAGADDYLTKPFSVRELLAAVKANLDLRRSRHQKAMEALKESEERFRALFNQAAAGIAQTDLSGIFILVNQRYCEMVGRSPEELMRLRMQDITHPEDLKANLLLFERMILDGIPFAIEKRYIRPDGSLIWVRNHESLIWDSKGNPQSVLAVSQDITDQKQAEETLKISYDREQKAKEEAEKANRKKSEFLAMMSHELRTPLNAIIGYSRMIENHRAGPLTEKQQKYIQNVSTSGDHLLSIVHDLLDISKVEAGKMVISPGSFEIRTITDEVQAMMKVLAAKKAAQLFFEIPLDIDGMVADPDRFKQILINLISNAIKFNREGGSVWVRLNKAEENQWLIGVVEDTGIGIPQDKQAELFKKFYQIDTSTSRPYEGIGLGLALTKELIELHGGEIGVESTEGVGSTFTFRIPVYPHPIAMATGKDSPDDA